MKGRNSITVLTLAFLFFCFSPLAINAAPNEENKDEENIVEEDYIEKEEETTEGEGKEKTNAGEHEGSGNNKDAADEENKAKNNEDKKSESNVTADENEGQTKSADTIDENEEQAESEDTTDENEEQAESEDTTDRNEDQSESKNNKSEDRQEDEEKDEKRTISVQSAEVPFEPGDRHDDIVGLKQQLNAIGFDRISETDYFGEWTETRVTQFQEYYGLQVNGKLDQPTIDELNNVYNSPLQEGKRHDDMIDLKEKLNRIGYGYITVTDLFGSFTAQQVRKLQGDHGLTVNGIIDKVTRERIDYLAQMDGFQIGDRHDKIVGLKQMMNAIGFGGISETNYFGDWTKTRVTQFQEYYGLTANGTLDTATVEQLNKIYSHPFQQGNSHDDVVELKEQLNRIGYGHITVTSLYGSFTAQQVRKLQNDHGLKANGIADEKTKAKIDGLVIEAGFQLGDRHDDIVDLKKQLNAIGFDRISATNYFGEWTETRVTQFQEYYGLSKTGNLDKQTQNKLDSVYNTPFQLGERHDDTIQLKEDLNNIGFGYITVTSLYGNFTETQVRRFQEYFGLKSNGIADEVTLAKIDAIVSSPLQQGNRHDDIIDLKEKLNALGYDGISETNYFGNWSETRLKQFQEDNGLRVNGIADEVTLKELEKAYQNRVVKIFLDPGHGDHDPGGQGYGLDEKDVVLDIALKTADVLLSTYTGVDVKLSRIDDTFVELEDRADQANQWGADYFASFHVNAWLGRGNGFESYIHNGNVSNETKERQEDLHDYLIDRIDVNDRGKKEENFSVLRNSSMPAILLEYMFIDNYEENQKLKDASYRDFLGRITAEAIAFSFGLNRK